MKKGLGKGLNALMGEPFSEIGTGGVTEVAVSLIDTDKKQPRKHFDEEKLNELAESMRTHGCVQPLIVTRRDGRYVIVAGERRYRAARIAGLKTLPVIVKDLSSQDVLEISLIENIQREDLNAIEQSEALITLMERYRLTQEQAAERVGKSRSAIANLVRLASLPEGVRGAVREGRLSGGHARALLGLKDAEIIEPTAQTVMERGLSVRETEALVKTLNQPPRPVAAREQPDGWKHAESALSDTLDTRVRLTGNSGKGKIVIEFYSEDQLKDLFDRLNRQ